jgi:hypothetical protein
LHVVEFWIFEIAPVLFTRAALHVWHMKVLLYAVFKDQRDDDTREREPIASLGKMPA